MDQNSEPMVCTVDPVIVEQFTGQRTILDPAVARTQVVQAEARLAAATAEVKLAKGQIRYRLIRLYATRIGMPTWALCLCLGTSGALLLAGFGLVIGVGAALLFWALLVGYLAGGLPPLWLLRRLDGENDQNTLEVRTDKFKAAMARQAIAEAAAKEISVDVQNARRFRDLLLQAAASVENKRRAETNRLLAIDPGRLYPDELEIHVGDIFRHLGYTVDLTGKSGDQGVDVLARRGATKVAVQVKRYAGSVGNSAVQEAYAGMAHYRCNQCVVVTSGEFTTPARELAQSTGCRLIDKDQLPALIRGELGF